MKRLHNTFFLLILLLLLCSCRGTATMPSDVQSAPTAENITETDNSSAENSAEPIVAPSADSGSSAPKQKPPMPVPPIAPGADYKTGVYEKLAADYEIPIIHVYTRNREEVLSLEEYVECVVDIFNCEDEFKMNEAAAGIKVRGNSSAHYGDVDMIRKEKAPYRIKFEEKQNMLGLNDGAKCKSWVLLKTDWNLVQNSVAFRMGRTLLGEDNFCSDSTFVHLYINEELQGIYLLCEQSQVNQNRVNISEPKEKENAIHIGYFLELDNYAGSEDDPYFTLKYADGNVTDIEGVNRNFVWADYTVKSDTYSDAQLRFIELYMNNLFKALYQACVNDKYMTLNTYGSLVASDYTSAYEVADTLLDLESVVDMYILYEIVHDNDCGEGSFFMSIDFAPNAVSRNTNSNGSTATGNTALNTAPLPKLRFTCPWDFNWAYSGDAAGQYYAAAFNDEEFVASMGDRSNPWFILLMTEDWFVDLVKQHWTEVRLDGSLEACLQYEEDYILSHEKEINITAEWLSYAGLDLLTWIRSRIEWLDSQWLLPQATPEALQSQMTQPQ